MEDVVQKTSKDIQQEDKHNIGDPSKKTVTSKHICLICQDRLRVPCLQVKNVDGCRCDVHACKECISQYVRRKIEDFDEVVCLICKERIGGNIFTPGKKEMTYEYFIPDLVFALKLDSIYGDGIRCLKCDWVGPRIAYETHHEATCEGREEQCPNGCDFIGSKTAIKTHLNDCPRVLVTCEFCRYEIMKCQIDMHMCPEIPIPCKYCKSNICNKNIDEHEALCEKDLPEMLLNMVDNMKKHISNLENRIKNLETTAFGDKKIE